jgi:hypothetical protein
VFFFFFFFFLISQQNNNSALQSMECQFRGSLRERLSWLSIVFIAVNCEWLREMARFFLVNLFNYSQLGWHGACFYSGMMHSQVGSGHGYLRRKIGGSGSLKRLRFLNSRWR